MKIAEYMMTNQFFAITAALFLSMPFIGCDYDEKIIVKPQEPIIQEEIKVQKKSSPVKKEKTYRCKWLDLEFSKEDYEMLCRTTFCEAGNQDLQTQTMVCLTILNRLQDGRGKTIKEVVYAKNAYEVTNWNDFEEKKWTKQVEKAVKIALRENNHPSDMYYFRTDYFHGFGEPYEKSGALYFSREGD